MSISKIFGALALASFLVGCAASPLSDAQKAQFKDVNKNVSSVLNNSSGKGVLPFGHFATSPGEKTELDTKLADKLKNCTVTAPAADASAKNIVVKVDGPNCGLSVDMNINMGDASGDSVNATFKVNFEIKDADLLALSDVSKMEMSGYMKVSAASIDAKITGSIISKKHGTISINMTASGSAKTGASMQVRYSSKSFDINVEANQSANGKASYRLNGKDSTAKEINDLFNGGGMVPGTSLKPSESESTSDSVVLGLDE